MLHLNVSELFWNVIQYLMQLVVNKVPLMLNILLKLSFLCLGRPVDVWCIAHAGLVGMGMDIYM